MLIYTVGRKYALIVICKLRHTEIVQQQEQQPVFLLEYVSWRGIPHYTIILFDFNAEGPNCSIRVFLLIGITVWGQEHRCMIQMLNTPQVSVFQRPGGMLEAAGLKRMTSDESTAACSVPEKQHYYVWFHLNSLLEKGKSCLSFWVGVMFCVNSSTCESHILI